MNQGHKDTGAVLGQTRATIGLPDQRHVWRAHNRNRPYVAAAAVCMCWSSPGCGHSRTTVPTLFIYVTTATPNVSSLRTENRELHFCWMMENPPARVLSTAAVITFG